MHRVKDVDPEPASSGRIRDPVFEVISRLGRSARPGERWLAGYAKAKVRADGLYRAALPWVPPEAKVLDLGCGVGLLGMLLEARGLGNEVHGIEWDPSKARFAQRLAENNPAIRVVCGDLSVEAWPACSVVSVLDVLHYFPPDQQRALLIRIGAHLPEGGRLLLRVMDARAGGMAMFSRLFERVAVRIGWNRAFHVHWRPLAVVQRDLLDAGFSMLPAGRTNGIRGNCLLVCERTDGLLNPGAPASA